LPASYSSADVAVRVGLRKLSPPSRKILRVLNQTVGDRGGDGPVEQNVAAVGERSVGRDVVDRLLLWRVEMTGTGEEKSRDNHLSSRGTAVALVRHCSC